LGEIVRLRLGLKLGNESKLSIALSKGDNLMKKSIAVDYLKEDAEVVESIAFNDLVNIT